MKTYDIQAHAKINLSLDILGKLDNGYHEVRMVMQSISLADQLHLCVAPVGTGIRMHNDARLPNGERNLVYRAAQMMSEHFGIRDGLSIQLEKRIPIAAGLGGGSSDAAAVMLAMNDLFDLGATVEQLETLASSLGADVPFCLHGGTMLAEGIGDRLTVLPPVTPLYLIVDKPNFAVSTKWVYNHYDPSKVLKHPDTDAILAAIQNAEVGAMIAGMENVLESVTLPKHPMLQPIKNRLLKLGAIKSLMSGSGPTVFGLFLDQDTRDEALMRLRSERKHDFMEGTMFESKRAKRALSNF
ncbi:MAG: 4-(cytidine 5'-diphospho)-2-C-methyl-D-erythritol kinase [Clostridium sp.]|nr:4-(cytidine 5'-diphospho)-2-C-methyl-D-erythritol kinase [Clostridium sp.]